MVKGRVGVLTRTTGEIITLGEGDPVPGVSGQVF